MVKLASSPLSLVATILSSSLMLSTSVKAEENATAPTLEEIIVVGTRFPGRTVANSPVPIDIFRGEELQDMGTGDMDAILRTLVPSYNVQLYPLDDESSLIRPATLRGLPPDNTLILVNGKRRHRSGVLASAAGGAQGPDMSVLPAIALQRVEVLRDGASAQYGSDAIAGVLNFVMRENDDGLIIDYKRGGFFAGDGQSDQLGINYGMAVGNAGFVNLSLEYVKETPVHAVSNALMPGHWQT